MGGSGNGNEAESYGFHSYENKLETIVQQLIDFNLISTNNFINPKKEINPKHNPKHNSKQELAKVDKGRDRYPNIFSKTDYEVNLDPALLDDLSGNVPGAASQQSQYSTYINATYIWPDGNPDGKDKKKSPYIATQAPLENTISHFWYMVWQQNVERIIMLMDSDEKKHINDKNYGLYIPENNLNVYPTKINDQDLFITIELLKVEKLYKDEFIVRVIKIIKGEEERFCLHFQYPKWKNMSAINSNDILSFRKLVLAEYKSTHEENTTQPALAYNIKKHNYEGKNPLLVHCGAGCGRTGTYIAIDFLLNKINTLLEFTKSLDQVFEFPLILNIDDVIANMRKCRTEMVQRQEQYEMIKKPILPKYFELLKIYFDKSKEEPIYAEPVPPRPPPRTGRGTNKETFGFGGLLPN